MDSIERELQAAREALRLSTQELQQQQDRFAVALASISEAVVTCDVDGRVVFLNATAERLSGWTDSQVRGQPLDEILHFIHEDTRLPRANAAAQALQTGLRVEPAARTILLDRHGVETAVEDHAAPVRDAHGCITGAVLILHEVTERRRAENALRRGEAQMRAVFNQAAVGIAVADLNHRFLDANSRACAIMGYSLPELQQLTFLDLTLPEDRGATREEVRRLFAGEIAHYALEKRYVRKDGRVIWVNVTVTLLFDSSGTANRMIGVIDDITERKSAEVAALQVAQRLQLVLAASGLGDWLWNASTDLMSLSARAAEILAMEATPVLHWDKLREMLFDPEDIERGRNAVRVALASRTDYTMEYRVRRPSGEHRWVATRGRGIYAPDGSVSGMIGVLQDITERKRSDAARSHLAAVVESSEDAIISKTLEGKIQTWNSAAQRIFGHAAEDVLGKPISILIPDEFLAEEPRILARLRRGERIEHFETVRKRKDGTLFNASITVSPIRDEHGTVVGASKIARDITQQKELYAALRETDRRKDEFLATLAHELRNPLAPIRQAALISKDPAASELQKRWSHEVIGRQVQHMALLLDDLLDISRITRGTLELRTEGTNLGSIVEAAVETAKPAIDARHHELRIELPSAPVHFRADPLRLAQVLSNLLTNAAKYTDPRGQIALLAERTSEELVISVRDTGIGIAPEALQGVFEMFSQVTASRDRSEGGLGIGLALSRGLIELHGGSIAAHSQGIGKGSEFVVRLPLNLLPDKTADMPSGEPSPLAVSRRVLVADDNRDAADSLAMLLEIDGHRVQVVHNGRAALDAIIQSPPDVALLDIGMPGLNGYEIARAARALPQCSEVLLIAVTGWGQENDKAQAIAAGFDHHFTKPVDPQKLAELLRAPAAP